MQMPLPIVKAFCQVCATEVHNLRPFENNVNARNEFPREACPNSDGPVRHPRVIRMIFWTPDVDDQFANFEDYRTGASL
jgi:hypothetical protein